MARFLISISLLILLARTSHAGVQVEEFTDRDEWEAAVGAFTTIDFTGFPDGTIIDDQYADLGVHFPSLTFIWETTLSVNDGFGLHGPAPDGVWITFDTPMQWIAVDHPGIAAFRLFNEDELIYESSHFQDMPVGNFAGLVSEVSFNEVHILKEPLAPNNVFIDDLHFGPAIPAPGALGLLALGALIGPRRRRA